MCDTVINQCQGHGYDEFNRLTAVSGGNSSYTYSYDRYGNRTQQTSSQIGPAPSYSFDPATNRIQGMSYDAAGNVANDGFHSYTYDAEGNVLSVDNGNTAQYVYDVMNHRVQAPTNYGLSEFLYDPFGHRTSTWIVANNFGNEGRIYMDGQQIAFRDYDGKTYFDHQDWLGTERMRTDPQGQTAEVSRSLAYGDGFTESTSPNVDQDNYHFAGLDHDKESNTDNAQFRQYSPTQGRWMSPDPYDGSYDTGNPQSLNRYTYVLNQPMSYQDPSGLISIRNGESVTVYAFPDDDDYSWLDWNSYYYGGGGGSDGGGGGGVGVASADPNKCSTATPSLLPHGVGIIGGAELTAGSGTGATIQGSAGYGWFSSPTGGVNSGGFKSFVAAGRLGPWTAGNVSQGGEGSPLPLFAGAAAGYGGGLMLTNARNVGQLSGPFTSINLTTPIGSFNFSYGGGIWTGAMTAGPGAGAALSITQTPTKTGAVHGPC